MIWLVLFFGFAVLLVSVPNPRRSSVDKWPTFSKTVLTKHEQPAYWHIQKALPEYVVLAQVQLSRFLGITAKRHRRAWLNRIDRKSADFLVCRRDFSVLAVIELDDSSHDRLDAQKRDADKDAALSAAGIKVIRWRRLPDLDQVRCQVEALQKTS